MLILQGKPGAAGPDGKTGARGPDGMRGPAGAPGRPGPAVSTIDPSLSEHDDMTSTLKVKISGHNNSLSQPFLALNLL